MKNIFYSIFIAGLALASAACQKIDEQTITPDEPGQGALVATGSIVNFDATKVTYEFQEEEGKTSPKNGIKAKWYAGNENGDGADQIFGFDDQGDKFTFTVSGITEDGHAVFNTNGYTPQEGVTTLYAVYYPGKSVSDISSNQISVNLSSQDGTLGNSTPAIMCATGTIDNGKVTFKFENQTAIVGIYMMKIVDDNKTVVAGKKITKITLNGVLTEGTIGKNKVGELILGNQKTESEISATGLELISDDNGYIAVKKDDIKPYFAVINGNSEISVTATADDGTVYRNLTTIASGTITKGYYYYIGKELGTKVVASIGDNEYATIDDAFRAVSGGQTIKLEDNCAFATEVTLQGKSGNVTLNLNGHTLTNNGNNRINLNNADATLTIVGGKSLGADEDGTITTNNKDAAVIKVTAGHLIVNSGEILVNDSDETTVSGKSAIWVQNTAANPPAASVTINGGKITGLSQAETAKRCYALYVENTKASVNIYGGTFSSQSNNLRIIKASSVNITGGTFNSPTSSTEYTIRLAGDYTCNIGSNSGSEEIVVSGISNPVYIYSGTINLNVYSGRYSTSSGTASLISKASGNSSPINVYGGSFSRMINAAYLSTGCQSCYTEISEEYPWEVLSPQNENTVAYFIGNGGKAEKQSINDAVTAANSATNSCKIILVSDCSVTGNGYVDLTEGGVAVTLDLNGKTLTQNNTGRIRVDGGKLSILDNQTGGTIKQATGTGSYFTLPITSGQLDISSGTIEGNQSYALNVTGGEVNISGGTITSSAHNALYISGTSNVECNITGGTITNSTVNQSTLKINNTSATVTIDGENVKITAPKNDANNAIIGVVSVTNGTLHLKNGSIGGTTNNMTAVRVDTGNFTMDGGSISGARFAMYLGGSGTVIINNGEVRNNSTNNHYNVVRFSTSSSNQLIFNDGYLFVNGDNGTLFGTSNLTGNKTIPATATVTVNAGYFSKEVSNDSDTGYSGLILNGTCTQLTTPVPGPSGKFYGYQVTPK